MDRKWMFKSFLYKVILGRWTPGLETAEHCADQQGDYAVCHPNEREAGYHDNSPGQTIDIPCLRLVGACEPCS